MKCSDWTWAAPASSSRNASTITYSFGSSTLRDQSNHRQPGSARVASVNSRVISGQLSACSGLTWNLAVMKIMTLLVGAGRGHRWSPSATILRVVVPGGSEDDRGMTRIAFLGTGVMGAPMAVNIAEAGFEVRAWNRTRAKAEPLVEHGIVVVDTPREAVGGADVVVTMLADGPGVDDAIGAAELENGQLWLQMSTVGVEWAAALARIADKAGAVYVDAPVLGTRQPAEAGRLVVL